MNWSMGKFSAFLFNLVLSMKINPKKVKKVKKYGDENDLQK